MNVTVRIEFGETWLLLLALQNAKGVNVVGKFKLLKRYEDLPAVGRIGCVKFNHGNAWLFSGKRGSKACMPIPGVADM